MLFPTHASLKHCFPLCPCNNHQPLFLLLQWAIPPLAYYNRPLNFEVVQITIINYPFFEIWNHMFNHLTLFKIIKIMSYSTDVNWMDYIFYQTAFASLDNCSMALYLFFQFNIYPWKFHFLSVSLCTSIAHNLSLDTKTSSWINVIAPPQGFLHPRLTVSLLSLENKDN